MRAVSLGVAAALAACATPIEPRLGDIEQRIFALNCNTSSCHSAAGKQAGLDLTPGHAYAALVGVPGQHKGAVARGLVRVKAGSPEESLLVLKLREKVAAELGVRMPQTRAALEADELAAIEEWIRLGAKND